MANRYGRKQKRAHRAALTELQQRALDMSRHYQRLIGGLEERVRARDEAMRLLGAGYGKHILEEMVEQTASKFLRKAVEELGRNGLAAMQVSVARRPMMQDRVMREVSVVRVLIPEAEYHAVVNDRMAKYG
jgi:hypothetical protein